MIAYRGEVQFLQRKIGDFGFVVMAANTVLIEQGTLGGPP